MLAAWCLWTSLALGADPQYIEPNAQTGQSLAVRIDGGALVHTGQMLPLGSATAPTPPGDQVFQAFSKLRDALKAADAELADVVKLNVYVSHPSVTPLVEQELKTRFGAPSLPAVSFVQTKLPDPVAMVALDAVARSRRTEVSSVVLIGSPEKDQPAPAAILPAGGVVYISGQAEKGDGSLEDATRQTMAELFKTLEFLGSEANQVVQIKAFLTPMADSAAALKEMRAAFGEVPLPPVVLVEWESSLPIEIELVVAANGATAANPTAEPLEFLTPPWMTASPVFCRVTRVNVPGRIYVSGLYGSNMNPNSSAEVREVFSILQRALNAAGSDLKHLAKGTYYVSDAAVSKAFNDVRPQFYDSARPPAASKAQVTGSGKPPRTLSVDMIAVPKP